MLFYALVNLLPYDYPEPKTMELLRFELVNYLLLGVVLLGLKELGDLLIQLFLFGDLFCSLEVSGDSSLLSRRLNRSRLLLVEG